jgi:hypothetical protein
MLLLVAIGTVNYASEYLYELISIFNALWPLLAGGKIDLLTAGSVAKKKNTRDGKQLQLAVRAQSAVREVTPFRVVKQPHRHPSYYARWR